MTIDEVVLSARLRDLRREAVETDLCIANSRAQIAKDVARIDRQEARLNRLRAKIEDEERALYWVRMNELLHTPCLRYRVAG